MKIYILYNGFDLLQIYENFMMKIYIDMYLEMKDDFVFDCRIIGF